MQKLSDDLQAAAVAQPVYPLSGKVAGLYIPTRGAWRVMDFRVKCDLGHDMQAMMPGLDPDLDIESDYAKLDKNARKAIRFGISYTLNASSNLEGYMYQEMCELARGEPGIGEYERVMVPHGPAGFLDGAHPKLDVDNVYMDVLFFGNDNGMRGEAGNAMFRALRDNENLAHARGPVVVLFYTFVEAMPFTDDHKKYFSVTDDMVRPCFDALRAAVEDEMEGRVKHMT